MIKGSIRQEYITIVNIYTSDMEAPKYIKQILTYLKGGIDSNTIILRDFATSFSTNGRSSRQKINEEMVDLNYASELCEVMDMLLSLTVVIISQCTCIVNFYLSISPQ